LAEAAQAYRANPFADPEALADRVEDRVYEVRREAVLLAARHPDEKKRVALAERLLVDGGMFGSRDDVLRENIALCAEARLYEATTRLSELAATVPLICVRSRRDILRAEAARAVKVLSAKEST
jgi:Arc/MetJ-type ribon-helix-helix transcriptional regulator